MGSNTINTELRNKLEGQSILFIAPQFYHYSDVLREKLQAYGASVDFFYERDVTIKHALVDSFFKSKMDSWQRRHYNSILTKTAGKKYHYLFVIRGYKMETAFVEEVRKRNPGIVTLLYQWDSIHAWESDYRHLIPAFDKVFTFDYADAALLNIPYVPTFHTDEYAHMPGRKKEYDFLFCTSYTREKYEFMQQLVAYCRQKGYRLKTHIYISYKRYITERLKGVTINRKDIAFHRLNRQAYADLFSRSGAIVDFAGTTQTGLTMRVVDALGAGKRVISNNGAVAQEPGFNARQIVLFDTARFELPDWVTNDETFEKIDYSADKWLERIFK
ncbi:CgeB family protein [Filimonas effusa]|uniref:Lipopolysaccharide biosynthesis protein n=1 Tax=Filimonas effusa TaxID=2508721 RepID=A0A4Q1D204_9BACT|nr:hypothetical protein [Filimonas effusa]RXK81814.1 hypothetical protein ESB13_18660 [Filimonas effusa]